MAAPGRAPAGAATVDAALPVDSAARDEARSDTSTSAAPRRTGKEVRRPSDVVLPWRGSRWRAPPPAEVVALPASSTGSRQEHGLLLADDPTCRAQGH